MKILIDTKRDSISELRSAVNLLEHLIEIKIKHKGESNDYYKSNDNETSKNKNYDVSEESINNFSAMFGKEDNQGPTAENKENQKDENNNEENSDVQVEFY